MVRKEVWILNTIQLGPMVMNFDLLIFLLSSFIGYLALKYRLRMANVEAKISDKFINALILGFFTWKFSPIIFDPVSVIQYPLSILYFNGGDRGIGLAIAVSAIFLWVRTKKDGTSVMMNLDVLGTGWIAGSAVYHLLLLTVDRMNLVFHTLHIFLIVVLFIWLYKKKRSVGNALILFRIMLWYSLGIIGISFLEKERTYFLFGFSKEQILFFAVFFIALFVGSAFEKKK